MKIDTPNITYIIKSYERKDCVENLVLSIYQFINNPKIVLVDDSLAELDFCFGNNLVDYYYLGHNKGLSYGRNFAVGKVKTEYFVLLDDDFLFTHLTRIDILEKNIKELNADIVGAVCIDFGFKKRIYNGHYELEDGVLTLSISDNRNSLSKVDFCLNFFIARTIFVNKFGWDEKIKIHREHDDFFLTAKEYGGKVYHNDSVLIEHHPVISNIYSSTRKNVKEYEEYFNDKFSINKRVVLGKTSEIYSFYRAIVSPSFYKYIYCRYIKK